MVATVVVVAATHNLAYGVLLGALLAAMFFANKIGNYMYISSEASPEGDSRTYTQLRGHPLSIGSHFTLSGRA